MESMHSTERKPDQHPAGPSIFQSPQKRRLILCLLLVLATLALYNPVTRAPFLNLDDSVYVTDNLQVRAGLTWSTFVWAFRTPVALDWHPITWLSYLLDYQMFGMNSGGYHTVNVLFHATNAVLLFLILESVTGLAWRSLAVAALFALHPMNVESVAWIAERKNVLSMFFFLLALAAYGWYTRRPGVCRYLAVTLAYVLSLMSKAQAITFPFALLLLDYWPLGRLVPPEREGVGGESAAASVRGPSFWKLIWEKAPWFALSVVSAGVTMKTGGRRLAIPWIHPPPNGNSPSGYVWGMPRSPMANISERPFGRFIWRWSTRILVERLPSPQPCCLHWPSSPSPLLP